MEKPNQTNLKLARNAMLKLHKILLDQERANYEAKNGKVTSTGEYLQLVMENEQFAWLRQMSGLIVVIDEAFADKKNPIDEAKAFELAQTSRELLAPDGAHDFAKKYQAALEQSETAIFDYMDVKENLDAVFERM